jgi:hypothetical protein
VLLQVDGTGGALRLQVQEVATATVVGVAEVEMIGSRATENLNKTGIRDGVIEAGEEEEVVVVVDGLPLARRTQIQILRVGIQAGVIRFRLLRSFVRSPYLCNRIGFSFPSLSSPSTLCCDCSLLVFK